MLACEFCNIFIIQLCVHFFLVKKGIKKVFEERLKKGIKNESYEIVYSLLKYLIWVLFF